jgi:hypothetical protein
MNIQETHLDEMIAKHRIMLEKYKKNVDYLQNVSNKKFEVIITLACLCRLKVSRKKHFHRVHRIMTKCE